MNKKKLIAGLMAGGLSVLLFSQPQPAFAISLRDAIAVALESNPEIGQAVEKREAIQFELRQARGLMLPSVDIVGEIGARRLDNPSRRAAIPPLNRDALYPAEIGATVTQRLFDGWETRSEIDRQTSRVDGASFRLLERSEFVALQISREYFEALLQARIVAITRDNLSFHQSILGDIRAGVQRGSLTEADLMQAQERVFAARARLQEASEELAKAKIRFNVLATIPLGNAMFPPSLAGHLPRSLEEAVAVARDNNPRIGGAGADIDAAEALVEKARADYLPDVNLELNARTGNDIDGADERGDVSARVVMRWNIFRGGITSAEEQKQIRGASQERYKFHQIQREVEEAVHISWDRRIRQNGLLRTYLQQMKANSGVVMAYREQFRVGRRSLIDVLDARNALFNASVLKETAAYAARFAEYRLLAAMGRLLAVLDLTPPALGSDDPNRLDYRDPGN